jgi:hypothetical protein
MHLAFGTPFRHSLTAIAQRHPCDAILPCYSADSSRLAEGSSCLLSTSGGRLFDYAPDYVLSCMPASAARPGLTIGSCLFVLEWGCSALQESLSLESSSSPLLDSSTFDIGAPTPVKQSAAPPVQERPAPVRGRFLNFVEQRTRMDPSVRLGRAAKMSSHGRPSFHIWISFLSSSTHETLLFFGFNGAWCILECSAAS